jgi:hypothetical protein
MGRAGRDVKGILMPHKILKLSTLAILIAGASQASAAVYTVVPVDEGNKQITDEISKIEYFREAQANANETPISVVSTGISESKGENCFEDACVEVVNGQTVDINNYGITGVARRGTQGTPINDTVAYNQNDQHVNDFSELEQYCDANLNIGYCSNVQEGYMSWAGMQYFGDNYNPNASMSNEGVGGLQKKQAAWKNDYYLVIMFMVQQHLHYLKIQMAICLAHLKSVALLIQYLRK